MQEQIALDLHAQQRHSKATTALVPQPEVFHRTFFTDCEGVITKDEPSDEEPDPGFRHGQLKPRHKPLKWLSKFQQRLTNRDIDSPHQCYKLLLGYLPDEVKSEVTTFLGSGCWWPRHGDQYKAAPDFLICRYGNSDYFPHAAADIHLCFAAPPSTHNSEDT